MATESPTPADLRRILAQLPPGQCTIQAGKTLAYAEREAERGSPNAQAVLRRALAWLEAAAS